MRTMVWPIALATAAIVALPVCGDDGPVSSDFGLDARPANATCLAKARPVLNTGVKLQRMWPAVAFSAPIYVVQAPGDHDHWYVVERGGKIRTLLTDGTLQADLVSSVPDLRQDGEGGLLGFAFHPQWPTKREAYLSFTRTIDTGMTKDPAPICAAPDFVFTSVVARYQSSNGTKLDMGPDDILKVGQPFNNHNGGTIQFGRDGMLYFGLGDGGDGNDTCRAGQNLASPLGKILRIDVNAPKGMYKIPDQGPDKNPFVDTPGALKEIWSYGHRNPWRWSFDSATGDLWLGEVGQGTWEEIDRVTKGGNYGWRDCEGFHKTGDTQALCNTPGLIDPIVEHPRSDATSITGGYVYRGTAMPSLVGTYIYGDYVTGNVWALTYDADNKPTPKLLLNVGANQLASFGQDLDGEIYLVAIGSGQISKLVPSGAQPPDNFPQRLSQTGCVDPADPTRPAEGLIPYDVNAPLWSDGAEKQRWLAIPDGTTIAINADQDWELPIGSVAMKTFSVGGKRLETRLFMRHDDGGWAGYTYEWDADGKDATLLPSNKVKAIDDGATWAYPSRSQCIQCHSKAAGGTIGLETAQLNRDGVYPSTNRRANQLATFEHIGMLAAPLGKSPDELPRLSDPSGRDAIELRARSYLHGNCSHCHRPMGGGQGTMDLRFAGALKDTATCNADATQGGIGAATKLISPGKPDASVLSLRLHSTDAKRMPPVAVSVTDPQGSDVIDSWIKSLTACP